MTTITPQLLNKSLDRIISDEIRDIKALNELIRKIRECNPINNKSADLTQEQKEEIQNKIKQINEKEFPENFKQKIKSLTKHLTQFILHQENKSKGPDLKGEKRLEAVSSNQRSRASNNEKKCQLQVNEDIFGICNTTGSDCYQNSICQFLQCKTLKEHFVDRLPDNLWREFNRRPIHSKVLRDLIRKETHFQDDISYKQKDAYELLIFLSDRLDEENLQNNNKDEPKNKRDQPKTLAQKIKAILFSLILFPYFVWEKAINFLDRCLDKLLEIENNEEETKIEEVPLNSIVRPERKLKSDPNPLECKIFELKKWNVSDVPDMFKTNDYFGGENNETTKSTTELNVLNLPIDQGNNFQTLLANYFEEDEESHQPSSIPQKEPKIEAKYSLSRYYQEEPSSLILTLKRFSFEEGSTHKNGLEIEGIPARLKLPSKALKGKEPQKELELQSFIVHLGTSLNSGHYICYRKVQGEWYLFDDGANPKRLSEERAIKAAKDAYLIFYDQLAT